MALARLSDFSLRAFLTISENRSTAYSPFSTAKALELLQHGMQGKTAERLGSLLKDEALITPKLTTAKLAVEQSLWWDPTVKLKEPFVKVLREMPGSHLESVPFQTRPKEAASKINDWALRVSAGLIPLLVTADDLDVVITMLASSLLVQGKWNEQGIPLVVRKTDFHLLGGGQKSMPFLYSKQAENLYYQDSEAEIVELPLSGTKLRTWLSKLAPRDSYAMFPRMDVKADFKLKQLLVAEGLGGLFEVNPYYARLADGPMQLSGIRQKTVFKVDENGIEAAAVTYEELACARMDPVPPAFIQANRPFVFYLATKGNSEILFLGQFVE